MRLRKLSYANERVEAREKYSSSFIPYSHHYNSNTIVTKDGDLLSTIRVGGFSFETADDDALDSKKNMRNNLLKGMASANFSLWVHTIRRKHTAYPDGTFDGYFANLLNQEWRRRHNPEYTFMNEHYITLVRKSPGKIGTVEAFVERLQGGYSSEMYKNTLVEVYNEFLEMRERIVNGLWGYKVKLLGIQETECGTFSEILEFLGYIVNCGCAQRMLVPRGNIDRYILNQKLRFGRKTIEISGPKYHKYAGVISLKEYRPATYPGMLDGFLHLPCEFIICQSFKFIDRGNAITRMQLQQRRLVQAEDVAVSQIQEINEALDSAMGGEFAFGDHHLTIMCLHDNLKGLDNVLSQSIVEFANIGVSAVRESVNMEAAFWCQLPANFDFIVRKSTINTTNLASYASFHNYPSGKDKGNFWGNAVTVFNTTSGTPYFFNFHVRDVGHTLIIGPTGSGKTVILNFLGAQAQKFKPRSFFFDKDRGAEIFLRAIGGKYTILDPGQNCHFNPLRLEDTSENRNFLIEWIKAMVTTNGETVSADDMAKITAAVDGNYKLPLNDRRLSNIAPFLGMEVPGSLAGRLKMWHSDGSRARVFDNEDDVLDFSTVSIFGFEMGPILRDKVTLAPVLLYIFHRIGLALDGTPTMIILDEAWALIDNPVFAPKLKDWLKVMRKLNAFVVFATQSVEDAAKSQISDTLIQQTATQIFLPNLKATNVYRDVFMLSDREFAIVKNTDPGSRFFLIKQDNDGVVARLDLAGADDCINILSGRADTVLLLDQVRERVGDDPRVWLNIFLQEVRHI